MLPIIRTRTYYSDGTHVDVLGDKPPERRIDVQGIVYYHEPPYRTLEHGRSSDNPIPWLTAPDIFLMPGDWLPDADWEALYQRMRIE